MAVSSNQSALGSILRATLNVLSDGIMVLDPSGCLVFANEAQIKALGYGSLEAVLGASGDRLAENAEMFDEAGRPMPLSDTPAAKVLRGDPEAVALVRVRIRTTGFERWYEVRAVPFPIDGDGIRWVSVCSHDVTEARAMQEALRSRDGRAERERQQLRRIEALGTLAGGVAHDFNNLLTAINGYSDLMLGEIGSDAKLGHLADYVFEIRKAGESAAKVTQRLLAYGRRQMLQPQAFDLNGMILSMTGMLEATLAAHTRMQFQLDPGAGTVQMDLRQMKHVIMNLVSNARDSMPDGGIIGIGTFPAAFGQVQETFDAPMPPGKYAMLEVSDTGVGMDPEVKARIFEPFFTTKEMGRGIGLGLSMVQGIVRQSGGFIQVTSERKVGSRFRIFLPVAEAMEAAGPGEGSASSYSRKTGNETVLLVEDGDSVRKYTREILRRAGYRVLEAENGNEALELCNDFEGEIGLLLADLQMPEMTGPDLAIRLLQSRMGLKVLFMSGSADLSEFNPGLMDIGGNLLLKPFSPSTLVGRINAVFDR